MKLTKAKTAKQLAHVGSRSHSHLLDKLRGEARQRTRYIPVGAALRPSPQRDLGGLPGFELIRAEDGQWRRCADPEELGRYLIQEAKDRMTYQSWTSRHGKPELMTQRSSSPIQIHTVVWHPAVSDWIADQVAKGQQAQATLSG